MIKVGRLIVELLKWNSEKDNRKRRKTMPPYGKYKEKINIPYINDGDIHHQFDVIYAPKEKRKGCCVIDIHGGAYIFGDKQDNYNFMSIFVEQGYDVILVNYRLNDGKKLSTKDQVDDLAACINCVAGHLEELELDKDVFAITGDSAGGHFAFIISEALLNKEVARKLGYKFKELPVVATLINCPVYDFENVSKGTMYKSGQKRMFGRDFKDLSTFKLISPREYIESFKGALFLSSCKQDFIGMHSQLLNQDMQKKNNLYHFEYLDTDKKHVGHVHNILYLKQPEAIQVNNAMMDFIDLAMKQS